MLMRDAILKKVAATCLAMISLSTTAQATVFTIDASESFLTLGGTMLIGTDPGPPQPFFPQEPGSLTAALSGELRVDQLTGAIRIADSTIAPAIYDRPLLPGNLPATFAGMKPINEAYTLYFAMRETSARVAGEMPGTPVPGQFQVEETVVRFSARDLQAEIPGLGSTGVMTLRDGHSNYAASPATLSTVGGRYRLEVPVSTIFTSDFVVTRPDFELTGKIVAYAESTGPLTPEILDGGFEGNQWSSLATGSNNSGVLPVEVFSGDPELNGDLVGSISVIDGSATLRQRIAYPEFWQPNTQYEVTFDIGNLADSGLSQDEMVSARVFFALSGTDTTDFANHVGDFYGLDSLAEIADGEWLRNQTLTLDTTGFTENQLQRSLLLVLQATNSGGQSRSAVLFDNVRLAVVPEPATVLLAVIGALCVGVTARRANRRTVKGS